MVFLIGEKLDFLMKITNTRNSALGRALNFDPSYISRIRAGKRGVPKHQPFIASAAAFFAGRLNEPYQRKIAAETISPDAAWPESRQEAAERIAAWLGRADAEEETDPVARFLSGFAPRPAPPELPRTAPVPPPVTEPDACFYGGEGKRRAVELFLGTLCALGRPVTLLLWSDEDMGWLNGDPDFPRRWALLLFQLLRTGSRIRIVHTVSRNMTEMLDGLRKWIPLYMTGGIEPWYCPLPRDGVVRRTLFIARGHSAIVSGSIRNRSDGMLNFMTSDPRAVAALEQEFENYLSLCAPLMEIYTRPVDAAAERRLADVYRELLSAPGDLISLRDLPSPATLPKKTLDGLAVRAGGRFAADMRESARDLSARLREGRRVTEILRLPPEGMADTLPSLCDLAGRPVAAYERTELADHIRAALELSRREKNYRLVLAGDTPEHIYIRASGPENVLIACPGPPGIAFRVREAHITASLWEYLERIAAPSADADKALEAYLARMEKGGS